MGRNKQIPNAKRHCRLVRARKLAEQAQAEGDQKLRKQLLRQATLLKMVKGAGTWKLSHET